MRMYMYVTYMCIYVYIYLQTSVVGRFLNKQTKGIQPSVKLIVIGGWISPKGSQIYENYLRQRAIVKPALT
jgi:hypothetical protein